MTPIPSGQAEPQDVAALVGHNRGHHVGPGPSQHTRARPQPFAESNVCGPATGAKGYPQRGPTFGMGSPLPSVHSEALTGAAVPQCISRRQSGCCSGLASRPISRCHQ